MVHVEYLEYLQFLVFANEHGIDVPETYYHTMYYVIMWNYFIAGMLSLVVWFKIGLPDKVINMENRNLLTLMFPSLYKGKEL